MENWLSLLPYGSRVPVSPFSVDNAALHIIQTKSVSLSVFLVGTTNTVSTVITEIHVVNM